MATLEKTDPITLAVVQGMLESTQREMTLTRRARPCSILRAITPTPCFSAPAR